MVKEEVRYNTIISDDISQAAKLLQRGELVAIPTETVYGLAANATDRDAIKKVFAVKRRPSHNPLIVHVADERQIMDYVTHIPWCISSLLEAFTPGPLTVLLPTNGQLPSVANNGQPLMAFRIPAHGVARQLLRLLDFPLVAPSANIYTTVSPTTAAHVLKNFSGTIPMILDGGECNVGIESTVVAASGDQIIMYREGAITKDDICRVTGLPVIPAGGHCSKASPGMSRLHYSPRTPLFLVDDITQEQIADPRRTGILTFNKQLDFIPPGQQIRLSVCSDMSEAARNLYKALHQLDELNLDRLVAERLPEYGMGKAINDRLERAAFRSS